MTAKLLMFKITFLSVILEALPLILLGSFISSLIHEFVSEEKIRRLLPSNKFLAIVAASFMGIIFPVCECAIVPIVRRLMKKGVPIFVAIPFMVTVPIVNPIVLFSTFIAFNGDWFFVIARGGMGILVAWALGLVLTQLNVPDKALMLPENEQSQDSGCSHDHDHNHGPSLVQLQLGPVKKKFPWQSIISHTASEFMDVGRLLILGAFLSALFKSFVSREAIIGLGLNPILSILVMMAIAFVLSLCSEADAFIARTFVGTFSTGSILAFLVLGPMIDIKNYLMLSGTFKHNFVVRLTALIAGFVFAITFAFNIL